MPQSDPLNDSLRNAWVGCAWPILRNLGQTAALFLLTAIAAVWAGSFWVFIGGMAVGAAMLTVLDRKVFRGRQLREREASNRLFGLPDRES